MLADRILWFKNIKPLYKQDKEAYLNSPEGTGFHLSFTCNVKRENVASTRVGDLIVLRQFGKVTHLVEVLDAEPKETGHADWPLELAVKTLWHRPLKKAPHQSEVFGTSINIQRGQLHALLTNKQLKEFWEVHGSMANFQIHITEYLAQVPA
jgi:hypothetical protein